MFADISCHSFFKLNAVNGSQFYQMIGNLQKYLHPIVKKNSIVYLFSPDFTSGSNKVFVCDKNLALK